MAGFLLTGMSALLLVLFLAFGGLLRASHMCVLRMFKRARTNTAKLFEIKMLTHTITFTDIITISGIHAYVLCCIRRRVQISNFEMASYNLTVICGKQSVAATVSSEDKICVLRQNVEQALGYVEDGIRLIFKGKSLSDTSTVQACGLQDGAKLMVLRTPKQLKAEREKEKQFKLQQVCSSSEAASNFTTFDTDQKPKILGDQEKPGTDFVVVKKGRDQYRVNAPKSASDVKKRIAVMIHTSNWKEIRLLGAGKFLKDDDAIKSGTTLMMLFTAKHHDRQEEAVEVKKLEEEVGQIENRFTAIQKQAARRLKDRNDILFEKSQINQDIRRIRDNLELIQDNNHAKVQLAERLTRLDVDSLGDP